MLSLHVVAGIVFVGPITVASSLFPRYARQALAGPGQDADRSTAVCAVLHRITRVYAVLGLTVPVFGVATAVQLGVLTDAWLLVSIALTVLAAAVLALLVLPGQRAAMGLITAGAPGAAESGLPARLAVAPGIFALLWVVIVVLMIVRPGSTTGV